MRSKGVFWGVILVSIGILLILRNFGVLYFSWYSLRSLWPVILVVLGISLLPIKDVVRIILAFMVVAAAFIFIDNTDYYKQSHGWFWNNNDDYSFQDDDYDNEWRDQLLYEDYNPDINNAVLNLEAIAGEFYIDSTTEYLLQFKREGNFGKYYLHADNEGSAVVLKLNMASNLKGGSKIQNSARIGLHPDPVWDLQIDAGAAKIDFDLSPFKIDRIDIDGGASSVTLRLGDKFEYTDLRIDSGAAAITIEIPVNSGCEVSTNTVLSSKILDGFNKLENGKYQTPDYDSATNKIVISLDAAISSLKVVRY